MKRVQYHRFGGPDVLRLEEFEPAEPGRGQVLVRVRAAAANPMDWKIRNGELRLMTGGGFPRGVGQDFAGVVEAVGEGVARLRVGEAVLGAASLRRPGAFAELVVADEKAVAVKPAGLTFEQAATLPVVGVTALQALTEAGKLQSGQAVFIHGCLGGVGRVAVQLAKLRGASVAGSCRATSMALAVELGVAPVVEFDVDPAPLERQFDVVFDTVGTLPIRTARTLIKPGGRIVDIVPTPRKLLRSIVPGPYSAFMGSTKVNDLEEIADAAARGDLHLSIARTVPLEHAVRALTELETSGTPRGGKLVVVMS
jgi:NADPH:quinone reductase-like Zn-dependent oxidoreductase